MKSLKERLISEKKTTGAGCVEMIRTIIDQLKNEHPNCKYDKEKNKWTGEDADLWQGASQFIYDYLDELSQSDLKKIVNEMGWKKWIADMDDDIMASEIAMCMALELGTDDF